MNHIHLSNRIGAASATTVIVGTVVLCWLFGWLQRSKVFEEYCLLKTARFVSVVRKHVRPHVFHTWLFTVEHDPFEVAAAQSKGQRSLRIWRTGTGLSSAHYYNFGRLSECILRDTIDTTQAVSYRVTPGFFLYGSLQVSRSARSGRSSGNIRDVCSKWQCGPKRICRGRSGCLLCPPCPHRPQCPLALAVLQASFAKDVFLLGSLLACDS
jgi:hypothetical protein